MRTAGLFLGILVSAAVSASAQSAPASQAPPLGLQFVGGKAVAPTVVACTDQPIVTLPTPSLRILAPHSADLRTAMSKNELVVLGAGTPQGLAVGQRYFTRRTFGPITREPISATERAAIRTTGWLTIVAADERFSLARIDFTCVAVEAGDYLEPFVEPAVPATPLADGPPDFNDMSHVLFGVDRHELFGAGDLLSIDRGETRGLKVGTRVAFYRDRLIGTPLYELGTGVVIEVSPETSKVAVERASPEIVGGDYVVIRRAP
jgi:hypothetical protein